ncbi:MAG: peptidoglycan DD-metalloendopeptidase family protein [Spirochaetia bacterium]|nr:peptidoglycan DD-metalloendopeptidase family protein [Spirochaetia bacterium]
MAAPTRLLVLLLLLVSGLTAESARVIERLSPDEPAIRELRREIAVNLKASARTGGLAVPLRFVKYKVKPEDNFYSIMAKASQDAETLSAVNGIIHPNALEAGQVLLIPNARGIAVEGVKDEVARRYGAPANSLVAFQDKWFLPGRKFEAQEMRYFKGDAFRSPLATLLMSSGYGMRSDPFTHKAVFHGGVDFAAATGSPVLASADGRVAFAGEYGGYGKLVILGHDFGYQTYYGHLSEIKVKAGQEIKSGSVVGGVGATGRATGPHLHFEIRKMGRFQNPLAGLVRPEKQQSIHRGL